MTGAEPEGFSCAVLYGVDVAPDWDDVINLADRHYPREGCVPDDVSTVMETARLEYPDGAVEMRFRHGKIRQEGLPPHKARIIVSCEPNVREAVRFGTLCRLSREVTKLASALSRRKDCVGVFTESTLQTLDAREFRKASRGIDSGRNPLPLWIGFGHTSGLRGLGDQPMITVWTRGLSAFFGHEAELEPEEADLADLRRTLGGFVAYLFTRGHGASEGEVMRQDEVGQTFRVQMQPKGRMADTPVYELVRVDPEAEKAVESDDSESVAPEPVPQLPSLDAVVIVEPGIRLERSAVIAALIGHGARRQTEVRVENGPDKQSLKAVWLRPEQTPRTDVVLHVRDYTMPSPMIEFLIGENPQTLSGASGLQMADGHVLIEATPTQASPAARMEAASLAAHSAMAMLSLPGVRGIAWPGSGVFLPRIEASEAPSSGTMDLPLNFCVAILRDAQSHGKPVLVTRGMEEFGEPELLMSLEKIDNTAAETAFHAALEHAVRGELSESTQRFAESQTGGVFNLKLSERRGIGSVLELVVDKPPRGSRGLARLFSRR